MIRACDNPFRADRVEALRYRSPGFAWHRVLARLERQGGRGAIRGAPGSGKTTLLHELGDCLAEDGYEVRRLRPDLDDRCLAALQVRQLGTRPSASAALLLDGADRVGALDWLRLRRRARGAAVLVVTTHREGRLPTLYRCSMSVGLLNDLVRELEPDMAKDIEGERLLAQSGGNVRIALRALYDRAAMRSRP